MHPFYDYVHSHSSNQKVKDKAERLKKRSGGGAIEGKVEVVELPVVNMEIDFPIQVKGIDVQLQQYHFGKKLLRFNWQGLDIQCFSQKAKIDAREGVVDTAYFSEQELRSDDGEIHRQKDKWIAADNDYELSFVKNGLSIQRKGAQLELAWGKTNDGKENAK